MKLPLFNGWSLELKRTVKIQEKRPERPSYDKVFVIGMNKTGTTTLYVSLKALGFKMGNTSVAETLAGEWVKNGDLDKMRRYIDTADAFQDAPFSIPGFYTWLTEEYPKAKFILTVRDTPEQWLASMKRFQSARLSSVPGEFIAENALKNSTYVYKGWSYDMMRHIYHLPEVPLYDEAHYTSVYQGHIDSVLNHFKDKSDRFLSLNVAHDGAYSRLLEFLEIQIGPNTPHNFGVFNKTKKK